MLKIQDRFDHLIVNTQRRLIDENFILPQKTDLGILVGNVLIASEGSYKNLIQNNRTIYENIYLNCVAIKLANLLARNSNKVLADKIYTADQEYGRWFLDSQILRKRYEKCKSKKEYDKADILWARYIESRNKALSTRNYASLLTDF